MHPQNPAPVLIEALLIYSHLARLNKDFYPALGQAGIAAQLRALLHHPEASVRAKACNMIGNMCKHSDYFYGALLDGGLLDSLIQLCSDTDRTTRKFACFAIGNAGFHSGDLYGALRGSIPALVTLLSDEESKTRANAAGALGNFVRNSEGLCGDLVACGAPEALLRMVSNRDGAAGATPRTTGATSSSQGGAAATSDSGSPIKMALFSLGNMCAYPQCRERLLALGLLKVIAPLAAAEDATIKKFIARIQAKIQQ
jgi:fused